MILWWIKRDARVHDNPTFEACVKRSIELKIPFQAFYLIEPEEMQHPDYSEKRRLFVLQGLKHLKEALKKFGVCLKVCECSAENFFLSLFEMKFEKSGTNFFEIFSTEETGTLWTYERDIKIKKILSSKKTIWHELPNNGVVRRLKSRDDWKNILLKRMLTPEISVECLQEICAQTQAELQTNFITTNLPFETNSLRIKYWNWDAKTGIQIGGENEAFKRLNFFIDQKILQKYTLYLASPNKNFEYGSRMSAYLSFGHISSKTFRNKLLDEMKKHRLFVDENAILNSRRTSAFNVSEESVMSRLAWREHFIQKLEDFPTMENEEQNSALKNLREDWNEHLKEAWILGKTGYPFIDACLRAVHTTGYLNFRARAMLMSFGTHLLWRDWRFPAWNLAQSFLDYEPGIHFSQVQMQSAVTGINQIRIYSPSKQSLQCDKFATFIKYWVPELKYKTNEEIHSMQNLPKTYPKPIVNEKEMMLHAREKLYSKIKETDVRTEGKKVFLKLGSRLKRDSSKI
jgi:deoxyribodipyrimidine photo-lyase